MKVEKNMLQWISKSLRFCLLLFLLYLRKINTTTVLIQTKHFFYYTSGGWGDVYIKKVFNKYITLDHFYTFRHTFCETLFMCSQCLPTNLSVFISVSRRVTQHFQMDFKWSLWRFQGFLSSFSMKWKMENERHTVGDDLWQQTQVGVRLVTFCNTGSKLSGVFWNLDEEVSLDIFLTAPHSLNFITFFFFNIYCSLSCSWHRTLCVFRCVVCWFHTFI